MSPAPLPVEDLHHSDLADRLCMTILRLSRQIRREAQRAGASALDAMLLATLKRQPGTGVSELADREQMSRPAMIEHLRRLEAAGWIARQETPIDGDRRRVGLEITPAGDVALAAIRRERAEWLAGRLEGLSEAELAALATAIDPLNHVVEARP
ncbi:MAG: MarR family transcriptional regulator [Caulobacteraceae bacterium]